MGEEFLTIKEAAQALGLTRTALYYYVRLGKLHLVYLNAARTYIRREEIDCLRDVRREAQLTK